MLKILKATMVLSLLIPAVWMVAGMVLLVIITE